jgi:hypothetical protein
MGLPRCRVLVAFAAAVRLVAQSSAVAAYATVSDTAIRIGNAELEVAFNRQNGGLDSLVHKKSGIDLRAVKTGTWPLLWGLRLESLSHSRSWADNVSSHRFSFLTRVDTGKATVQMAWEGLDTADGTRYPQVKVTAEISLTTGSRLSVWRIRIEHLTPLVVRAIFFPQFVGIATLGASGADDCLVVSSQQGRLFVNPATHLSWWGVYYPSAFATMQWFAYYDRQAGFFFSTRDPLGHTKFFLWNRKGTPQNDAELAIVHLFPATSQDGLELTYDTVVGVFQGDWHEAADLYKEWASRQWWVQQSKAKQTPEWLHRIGPGKEVHVHGVAGNPDRSFRDFIRLLRDARQYHGIPMLGLLWGWEKKGAWYYGDYFPPYEGWASFDRLIDEVHTTGDRLWLFVSPTLMETSTKLWTSGAPLAAAMRNRDGSVLLAPPWEAQRQYAFLCIAHTWWRQQVVDTVKVLARHGVDLIQLDGFPWIDPPDDYASHHGHPPGRGGKWWTEAHRSALAEIVGAARAEKSDVALSGEGGSELFLAFWTSFIPGTAGLSWQTAHFWSSLPK